MHTTRYIQLGLALVAAVLATGCLKSTSGPGSTGGAAPTSTGSGGAGGAGGAIGSSVATSGASATSGSSASGGAGGAGAGVSGSSGSSAVGGAGGASASSSTGGGACCAVQCDTAPAPTCQPGNVVRAYEAVGACSAGACSYPYTDTPCAAGCTAGACVQTATQLSATGAHACAIVDGGVQCWGLDSHGQLGDPALGDSAVPVDPIGLGAGIASVSAGFGFTCALTSSGQVKCWGANLDGQLGNGGKDDSFLPVDVSGLGCAVLALSSGARHSCAIDSGGAVACWGYNEYGALGNNSTVSSNVAVPVVGLGSGVLGVSAGESHSCAITAAGKVVCWGGNQSGQLGNDSVPWASGVPVPVMGLGSGVVAISAAQVHTCALTSGGVVECWGHNAYGEMGNGSTSWNPAPPGDVTGLGAGVLAVSAGGLHTCAITAAGAVKCWGYNGHGELGDGTTTTRLAPVDVVGLGSGVIAVNANEDHTCALTAAGAVKCWGSNSYGELGDGSATDSPVPVDVTSLGAGAAAVSMGVYHACAVAQGGAVKCWGSNYNGNLGRNFPGWSLFPVRATGLSAGVVAVSVGYERSCAITSAGALECWGDNTYGALGDGTTIDRRSAVGVVGLGSGVASVSAGWGFSIGNLSSNGSGHTCAVLAGGAVKCFGHNGYGELGDGSVTSSSVPVGVTGLGSGVIAASAGGRHTCALTSGGAVQCWGFNDDGELGNGSTIKSSVPVPVLGLGAGVVGVSSGYYHACAVTSGGAVQCWGSNTHGQLGDGTMVDRSAPVAVVGLGSGVVAVSCGFDHTCALLAGGAVACWGDNLSGMLGDGSTIDSAVPVGVTGLGPGVVATGAGAGSSCALTSTGKVQCWGANQAGMLGDSTGMDSLVPVEVTGL